MNHNTDSINKHPLIAEALDLLKSEQNEVQKHMALLELTKHNLVDTIKSCISYSWASEKTLTSAQKWLTMRDNCDKRKKYDEKEAYKLLTENMVWMLSADNITIKEIITCGYNAYAYTITFIVDNHDCLFHITVPMLNKLTSLMLTPKITDYSTAGMLQLGYQQGENGSLWNCQWSYELKDFSVTIQDILKECEKNSRKLTILPRE